MRPTIAHDGIRRARPEKLSEQRTNAQKDHIPGWRGEVPRTTERVAGAGQFPGGDGALPLWREAFPHKRLEDGVGIWLRDCRLDPQMPKQAH